MIIRITPNPSGNPPGKLADAEIIFGPGPLEGLRLIGFNIWERRGAGGNTVTFPARQYNINGERRSFALVRPVDDKTRKPADSTAPLRAMILAAYDSFEKNAERASVVEPTFDYIVQTDAQATYPDPNPGPADEIVNRLIDWYDENDGRNGPHAGSMFDDARTWNDAVHEAARKAVPNG